MIKTIHSQLFTDNGKTNWATVLYLIGIVCGIIGLIFSMHSALHVLFDGQHKFQISHLYLSFLMFSAFGLKIWSLWDKEMSRIFLPLLSIGWFIVFLINLVTFIEIYM